MEHLITSKALRFLKILEFSYSKAWVSIEDLSQLNNCSKNTVRSDLEYLEMQWSEQLQMEIDLLGVHFNNISSGDLIKIKKSILQSEVSLTLLISIFLNPEATIYDHSLELNYSESHLRKTIVKLNKFLKTKGFKIEYFKEGSDSKPTLTTQDEIKLCYFISDVCVAMGFEEQVKTEKEVAASVYSDFLNKLNLPVTTPMKEYMEVLSYISDVRYKQGFYTREEFMDAYTKIYQQYNMRDFIDLFNDSLGHELKDYFGIPYLEQHEADFKVVNDVLISMLLRILVSSSNIDTVLNRYDIFYSRFSIEHGRAYKVFRSTLDRYADLISKDFEAYYGEIIYNLYIHLPNLRPYKKVLLGIYSDMGVSHAYALLQSFERLFLSQTIEVFQEGVDYDYVLSTVSEDDMIDGYNVIKVSDLPGGDDLNRIYMTLYNKYKDLS